MVFVLCSEQFFCSQLHRVQCNLLAGVAVVPQSTVPLLIASTCPELKPANTFLGFKYSEYFSLIVKLEHFSYNS